MQRKRKRVIFTITLSEEFTPEEVFLSLCNIKEMFHSYGVCWYLQAGVEFSCSVDDAWQRSPHNPRLSVVLLIAIQSAHEYFISWRSHQVSRFLRRLG